MIAALRRYHGTRDVMLAALVAAIAAAAYSVLFDRESTLSYSIGYNLYGAERILGGEVPYRDFHTLYPPGTVYLNSALFRVFGGSLYVALFGVYVFRVATSVVVYLCARQVLPQVWSLAAVLTSLVWLRPNGPFKAVPMHYGAFFLAVALLMLLIHQRQGKVWRVFVAGIALGLLALFKHNIGAYALFGFMVASAIVDRRGRPGARQSSYYEFPLVLLAGLTLPVALVCAYMWSKGALSKMVTTLLFGPGDFLASRLASAPSPVKPLVFVLALVATGYVVHRLRVRERIAICLLVAVMMGFVLLFVYADQGTVSEMVFYAPVVVLVSGVLGYALGRADADSGPDSTPWLLVCAGAAFMEAFPRFAREQAIGAMPFVILLLFYISYRLRGVAGRVFGVLPARLALSLAPLILLVIGSRLFLGTFFDSSLRLVADTKLTLGRGAGVYFPSEKANEIDSVVGYIQQRVPEDGYVFAQSYAGSSFLFLADRRNPSAAQFWGGVGVTMEERARTLESLAARHVDLIITDSKDLAGERYAPLRDYIERCFRPAGQFGEILLLERTPEGEGQVDFRAR
jgi:hypothetical protein